MHSQGRGSALAVQGVVEALQELAELLPMDVAIGLVYVENVVDDKTEFQKEPTFEQHMNNDWGDATESLAASLA